MELLGYIYKNICISSLIPTLVLQEKLIQAIKKIKHEVDECHEAEKDTFADAVDVEVKTGYIKIFNFRLDSSENTGLTWNQYRKCICLTN